MAKTETKRQHYVPRTYLKHFATERDGNYFLKSLPVSNFKESEIHEVSIANACLQKDLYTLPGDTAEERMVIERFYSDNYEAQYDQIHQLLLDPNKKSISTVERELIISTVATMLFRTTKLMNQHNEHINRVLEYSYELCKQSGKDYFMVENEKVSISGKSLEQLQREIRIETRPGTVIIQLQFALRLIELRIARDGIFVSKLADGELEFVTSDNPVSYDLLHGGFTSKFNPDNILSLPLDSKHRLVLMPYADKDSLHLITRNFPNNTLGRIDMLTSNFTQSQNAERFMYGSDTSLRNYLKTKEETEKPISDEEFEKSPMLIEMKNELEKMKEILRGLENQ